MILNTVENTSVSYESQTEFNLDCVNSDQFTETSEMIQEKFNFSAINLNENLAVTLSILNTIAIIVMAIILKIKLSNKVIVSKPSK